MRKNCNLQNLLGTGTEALYIFFARVLEYDNFQDASKNCFAVAHCNDNFTRKQASFVFISLALLRNFLSLSLMIGLTHSNWQRDFILSVPRTVEYNTYNDMLVYRFCTCSILLVN